MMSRRYRTPDNQRHTSPNLTNSVCDGCRLLYVKDWDCETSGNPRMLDGVKRYPYYCDGLRRDLSKRDCYTMRAGECPEGRGR